MTTSYDIAQRHGMLDKGEIALLKACAMRLPKNPIVVNIGAGFGTSSAAILEERPDAFIFSCDKARRHEEHQALIDCGLEWQRCVRLLGLSWEIGMYFPYKIDMLFVDGAHYEVGVANDINTWLPHLRHDRPVLFHDYHHQKAPDVTRVVDRAMVGQEMVGLERYLVAFWYRHAN